jgi:hypothetical protein
MDKNIINHENSDRPSELKKKPDVEIFDPPMCCPTGLCGPSIDQALLDVSEMIANLQSKGYQVVRYQMSTHADAFIGNLEVMKLIRKKQMAALPIVVVRGKIIAEGYYPKLEEIQENIVGGKMA